MYLSLIVGKSSLRKMNHNNKSKSKFSVLQHCQANWCQLEDMVCFNCHFYGRLFLQLEGRKSYKNEYKSVFLVIAKHDEYLYLNLQVWYHKNFDLLKSNLMSNLDIQTKFQDAEVKFCCKLKFLLFSIRQLLVLFVCFFFFSGVKISFHRLHISQ